MSPTPAVAATEVRLLEGPNLYFTRPAVKITLALPGLLALDEAEIVGRGSAVSLTGAPGAAGTKVRQRYVLRLVERVLRRLARAGGTTRLGVRVRPGLRADEVIVAFPWRGRDRASALAEHLEVLLRDCHAGILHNAAFEAAGARVREVAPGPGPALTRPKVPVIAITGTNGKTTTTRLVAHIAMTAGLRTGWSSTDGVLVQGELVQRGDYSGPAGARAVLEAPGVQVGVLETARGGMLFKGLGIAHNDVSIVTNVSADHLGVQGIETLDELAEVKAIITKVTRPAGWVVLNGDDPRVWAMRTGASGQPWCFSLDPDSPALREALHLRGRGITILDGHLVLLAPGSGVRRLVSLLDVPLTLAGLSEHNTANVLAATAGALALGLEESAVVEGLRTFEPDPAHNPGRMNLYTLPVADGSVTVILDMAHNEAGLAALLAVAHGLRPPGAQLRLGLGTGGDRTDEILVRMGEQAGLGADRVHIVHKEHYLRGRTMAELEFHLREGLTRVGVTPLSSSETELDGLQTILAEAQDGDVIAVMCHSHRTQLHDWLLQHQARVDGAAAIRHKVVLGRGEHPLEAAIAAVWEQEDTGRRIELARQLVTEHPGDPRLLFELAGTHDNAGEEAAAVRVYDDALAAGLRQPHRHRALLQKASSLRHLGELSAALAVLDLAGAERPGDPAAACFRALVLHDLGRDSDAARDLLAVVLDHTHDVDVAEYRSALSGFAADAWPT